MEQSHSKPKRPEHLVLKEVPALPKIEPSQAAETSNIYSHYRSGLSNFRTSLSEHRTDLSEYRTDLSTERTEMSMRRTGMSFQRTRMSAERTLMSVIRTSLSLISFGFTIYQVFEKLHAAGTLGNPDAGHNFGITLVLIGIGMLVLGIVYHVQFMLGLRHERSQMQKDGLIYAQSRFPPSITLVAAILLLILGIVAIYSMISGNGPLG